MKKLVVIIFLASAAYAGVDDIVFIKGKVGNSFNENEVKVIDSLGQTYFLPRRVFPENFKFTQGKEFVLEVPEQHMVNVKPL
jgi:hypothetical protein